ncbi:hypothetical protein [Hymenobacter volaticus]|uniref:Haloperoxidase n=1 Tax=Hymenobacter volaticus TaxID=2932254 RepID=A0ABY4GDJ2_9BACT|nr:hypothetical protein [Hymenobacter volaticus]UOQ68821.1 hypothetical protein MUN86_25465 [Hymenobacter volaticus]
MIISSLSSIRLLLSVLLLVASVGWLSCRRPTPTDYEPTADRIGLVVDQMNELMMHDVTNPPLAARFFAYALLAGNEVLAQNDSTCPSMASRLHVPLTVPRPTGKVYSAQLTALLATLQTASKLQPSGVALQAREQELLEECRHRGMPAAVVTASQQYAQQVAQAVLAYAKQDKYYRISDLPRYAPTEGEGYWYPTPPGFFAAVEPYFSSIRPFFLDSAGQFAPAPPLAFSPSKGSGFYQLMDSVRQVGNTLTREQRQIASFWDCNPLLCKTRGTYKLGSRKCRRGRTG